MFVRHSHFNSETSNDVMFMKHNYTGKMISATHFSYVCVLSGLSSRVAWLVTKTGQQHWHIFSKTLKHSPICLLNFMLSLIKNKSKITKLSGLLCNVLTWLIQFMYLFMVRSQLWRSRHWSCVEVTLWGHLFPDERRTCPSSGPGPPAFSQRHTETPNEGATGHLI